MNDPTISVGFEFAEFLKYRVEKGDDVDSIMEEKERTKFTESIQNARLKSASSPSYFIMTINMNSPETKVTEKRRKFLSILMRSFFSSIIFCQELPGYFDKEIVAQCGASGYDYVKSEKESAVMWRKEDFDGETKDLNYKTSDKWPKEVRNKLAPDASEFLSRIAMVKLTPKELTKESVLAVSWHGPHYKSDKKKKIACSILSLPFSLK